MEKDLPHDLSISGTIFLGRKVNECVLVFYRVCMRVCVSELERVYVKECVCVYTRTCDSARLLFTCKEEQDLGEAGACHWRRQDG